MKKYCFTLDLKNDPGLIGQYIDHHQKVWPEIIDSIKAAGVLRMEIFHVDTRLFMILEANDAFSLKKKGEMDLANPKVQEWESLMDQYQERLPFAKEGEKWVLMDKIFDLSEF